MRLHRRMFIRYVCACLGLVVSFVGCGSPCKNPCQQAGQARCDGDRKMLCTKNLTTDCLEWVATQCAIGSTCRDFPAPAHCGTSTACQKTYQQRGCVGQEVYWIDTCGKPYEKWVACPSHTVCTNGLCQRKTSNCQDACASGQTQCSGSQIQLCARDSQTQCFVWTAARACPSGQSCKDNRCQGTGSCQNFCTAGEARCANAQRQLCQQQSDGCTAWATPQACPNGQVCQGGACVASQPSCPASCTSDAQCSASACGTRTACTNGSCQAPAAGCPASCTSDQACAVSACGAKTRCTNGSCQEPPAGCPASCNQDADCQVSGCTKTSCLNQVCSQNSQGNLTTEEKDLLDALNKARSDNGLPAVTIDTRLLCAARKHVQDVGASGACGHVGADGSWPWDRAKACGFPQTTWTVNEIAAGPGFKDGADAVWGWKHSSGHWAAIVHTQAKTVGVGVYKSCYIALFDCCVKQGD